MLIQYWIAVFIIMIVSIPGIIVFVKESYLLISAIYEWKKFSKKISNVESDQRDINAVQSIKRK
jgi:nitrogen fixation/metabolism regulation signal transduction histidine kinase